MSQAVLRPNLTKKKSMGSVPNCWKEILMCHAIRWFKCKLKPPKNEKPLPSLCQGRGGPPCPLLCPGEGWVTLFFTLSGKRVGHCSSLCPVGGLVALSFTLGEEWVILPFTLSRWRVILSFTLSRGMGGPLCPSLSGRLGHPVLHPVRKGWVTLFFTLSKGVWVPYPSLCPGGRVTLSFTLSRGGVGHLSFTLSRGRVGHPVQVQGASHLSFNLLGRAGSHPLWVGRWSTVLGWVDWSPLNRIRDTKENITFSHTEYV